MVEEDVRFNPFPGLRPFDEDEDYLFFGREQQIDELLTKLRTTRFLSVVGTSGSGKSSLVKCGLLPGLYGGFMAGTSSSWRICTFRPGTSPITNLSEALAQPGVLYDHLNPEDEDDIRMHASLLSATLRRSKRGVIDAVTEARLPKDENLLLVVDQFEELFRYSRLEKQQSSEERQSVAFVKLLLDAALQREQNIFVVITMRSDFLGDCTQFRGLPEAINQGQYLIPRMTRQQMKEAITGPVAVGGAEISSVLATRLLNDVGDDMDQLPVLQHALMRTWDRWEFDHEEGEPLDLRHYEAIGTMKEALSQHADEIFEELGTDELREACELIFKAITEKSEGGRGIRRPTPVPELLEITGLSQAQLVAVVEAFRKPGRRFLMPPPLEAIGEESVIDISHESLMRVWGRLMDWVNEEMVSAERYKELAKRAEKWHGLGTVDLLRDPELQLMINWRDTQKPTEAWARRFRELQYETAMVYLKVSEERRQQHEERLRRERRRRFRLIAGVALLLLIALIMSLFSYFDAVKARKAAQRQEVFANIAKGWAELSAEAADRAYRNAEVEKLKANRARERAEELFSENQTLLVDARKERKNAEEAKGRAEDERNKAELEGISADLFSVDAMLAEVDARYAQVATLKSLQETERLRSLAESHKLGNDALQLMEEGKLEEGAWLALEANEINEDNDGPLVNQEIYNALDQAHKESEVPEAYEFAIGSAEQGKYDARALAYNEAHGFIAAANDGGIVEIRDQEFNKLSAIEVGVPVRSMAWSKNGETLLIGLRNGQALSLKVDLTKPINYDLSGQVREQLANVPSVQEVRTLVLGSKEYAVICTPWELRVATLAQPNQTLLNWKPDSIPLLTTLVVDETIYVGNNGEVVALKPKAEGESLSWGSQQALSLAITEKELFRVSALAYHNGKMAIGSNTGTLWVLPLNNGFAGLDSAAIANGRFRKHQASITQLNFHPDGHQLLSTSMDQSARIWPAEFWTGQQNGREQSDVLLLPVHTGWVWDGIYIQGGKYVLTAGQDHYVRRWFSETQDLAEQVAIIYPRP